MKILEKTNVNVVKWGNGNGIRIPRSYLTKLGIRENETIEISLLENGISIKKKENYLVNRLEDFYGKHIEDIYVRSEEIEEVPVGEEVW